MRIAVHAGVTQSVIRLCRVSKISLQGSRCLSTSPSDPSKRKRCGKMSACIGRQKSRGMDPDVTYNLGGGPYDGQAQSPLGSGIVTAPSLQHIIQCGGLLTTAIAISHASSTISFSLGTITLNFGAISAQRLTGHRVGSVLEYAGCNMVVPVVVFLHVIFECRCNCKGEISFFCSGVLLPNSDQQVREWRIVSMSLHMSTSVQDMTERRMASVRLSPTPQGHEEDPDPKCGMVEVQNCAK